jgi:hypothetical protein
MSKATYENPWPERVDVVEARSILAEFVAGCSNQDIALLYAAASRKPVVLTWTGSDYLCYGPEGREWASLERAKRERESFPDLLAALKEIVDYDEGSSNPEDYGYEVLLRCKAAINKAEGRSE